METMIGCSKNFSRIREKGVTLLRKIKELSVQALIPKKQREVYDLITTQASFHKTKKWVSYFNAKKMSFNETGNPQLEFVQWNIEITNNEGRMKSIRRKPS
ncbi:hypothetical protein PIROE2DRAFT_10422 [Piromyces sp. E2]|nr:hypothetical protein PIROE2DRAFT_10422 [Piromyces sp. E2]|eukprot:OUM63113.1 hypothetical protein PIROE2DRAFT_10422 [Piromyces sp. E2]